MNTCTQCGEQFYDDGTDKEKCLDCRMLLSEFGNKRGEIDTVKYMNMGYAYRLLRGFNMLGASYDDNGGTI